MKNPIITRKTRKERFKNKICINIGGVGMQKEELIQLHTLFVQIKNELEKQMKDELNGAFKEYEQLGVLPHHVHKSKNAHKKAIFILGKEIAQLFSHARFSEMERVAQRLERMITKI